MFCFPTRKPVLTIYKRCAQTFRTPVQVYHNLYTMYFKACTQRCKATTWYIDALKIP